MTRFRVGWGEGLLVWVVGSSLRLKDVLRRLQEDDKVVGSKRESVHR